MDTYQKIRDYIEQYLIDKNLWKRPQGSSFGITKVANKVDQPPQDGPTPMDIGALQDNYHKGKGGKGRDQKGGKGKDHKGKSKGEHNKSGKNNWHQDDWQKKGGKGQYYQQYQKQDKGKGKGQNAKGKQDNGKGKGHVSNPHAGKQCHVCKKHGHIAADCWWKVGSVENAEQIDPGNKGSTGGSGGVGAIAGDVIFTINNVQQHVSACSSDPSHVSLLVDSGACESVLGKESLRAQLTVDLQNCFSVCKEPHCKFMANSILKCR